MLLYDHVLPVLLAALALDALLGDPPGLYKRVPHPVVLIGRLAERLERALYGGPRGRRLRGALLTMLVVAGAAAAGAGIAVVVRAPGEPWWLAGEALVASTLLAGCALHDHVRAVGRALVRGLEEGRAAVRHVVGRDPEALDCAGVARAAIESAAENLSDGVIAPALWYLLLGLPGLAAYKAINTLDSMIGYRNARYRVFGWAAARLDDGANLLPARLTAALLVLAAAALPKCSGRGAARVALRDGRRHRSPNAGWPEAAMAGALDLRLGGPRRYGGETMDEPWLGDGRAEATPGDIRRALVLYRGVWLLVALAVTAAAAAVHARP